MCHKRSEKSNNFEKKIKNGDKSDSVDFFNPPKPTSEAEQKAVGAQTIQFKL